MSPPNQRFAKCCAFCKHLDLSVWCELHHAYVGGYQVCDDYTESEGVEKALRSHKE